MSQNTARFTLEELIVKKLWVEGKRIQTLDLGALVVSDSSYNVGIGTDTPTVRLDISGTSGLRLPVGTTSERPNPSNLSGIIRYNSSTNSYEGYNMGGWTSLGGTTSIDQQTKIEADNNDGLKFITDNVERMRIKENGIIDISTNVNVSGTIAIENLDVSNNVQIYGYTNLKGGHLVIDDQYSSISNAMSKLEFKIRNNSNTPTLVGQILAVNDGTSAGNGKLKFQVADNSNYQDALIIDKDKNVTFTGSQLDISGGDILAQNITSSNQLQSHKMAVGGGMFHGPTSIVKMDISGSVNINSKYSNNNADVVLALGEIYRDSSTLGRMDFGKNGIRMWNSNISFSSNSCAFINIEGSGTNTTKLNMGKGVSSTFTNILTLDLANERVGIGTNSPAAKLHIKKSNENPNPSNYGHRALFIEAYAGEQGGENSIHLRDITSYSGYKGHIISLSILNGNNSEPVLCINPTTNNAIDDNNRGLFIEHGGNIGIGTSSPFNKTQIKGDNGLTISATATTGSRTAVLRLGSPYQDDHDAYCAKITSTNDQSLNYNSDLRFYTSSGDNQSANECMRIETNTLTLTNSIDINSGGTSHVGTTINEIIFRGDRNPRNSTASIYDVGRLSFEYEHGTYDTLSGSAAFVIKTREGWKDTGTLTERFRIAGNGYIAIGNNGNNPYTLFDITDIKSTTDSAATFRLYTGNFDGSGYTFTNTVVSIIERSVNDSSTSYSHLYGMVLGIGAHPTIGFKTKTGLGGTPTAVIELASGYTNTSEFSTATKNVSINAAGNSYFNGGNVGIGTTGPAYPLDIAHNDQDIQPDTLGYIYYNAGYGGSTTTDQADGNKHVAVRCDDGYYLGSGLVAYSDKRIKENIRDVSDNYALQTLRDISAVQYEYKDKVKRGFSTTIGFIAQQVNKHMPIAVSVEKDIITNEMRNIENPQWTTLTDSSGNNTFKLTINDLSDNSGNILYRFYVSNDPSGNDECKKEVYSLDTDPKSFLFDQSWNNVFVYGKQVDDFHTLDKQKLFTLNFAATQEIDRIQQQEKTKLEEANQKILELEAKNQQLETTLQQVLHRLDALENN